MTTIAVFRGNRIEVLLDKITIVYWTSDGPEFCIESVSSERKGKSNRSVLGERKIFMIGT